MADIIKNYLSYEGLSLYDQLIKEYIATADQAILNQILGQLDPTDAKTIAELNDLIAAASGTAGTALQQITVGTDGQFVTTTVSAKGDGTTQSVAVSVKTAAISGTEDGLVTASDARTSLNGKVDKVDGKGLSENDFTDDLKAKLEGIAEGAEVNVQADWNEANENSDAFIKNKPANLVQDADYVHTDNNFTTDLKTKLEGIEAGAEVNYIKSVGNNLAVDADGKLTVTIPEATVTGVDDTTVNGMKLALDGTNVKLVDDGLAATLTGKNVTVEKAEGTTDDQCVYVIKQGGVTVGTINHPKDMVVTSGEVVEVEGVKYLRLTIANQDEPVDIAVTDLVDLYTPGAGIAISDTNEVSIALNPTQGNVTLSTDGGLKATVDLSGKQDALSEAQLAAVNSGITTDKVTSYDSHIADTVVHITAAERTAWNAKQDAMVAITTDEINALFAETTSL